MTISFQAINGRRRHCIAFGLALIASGLKAKLAAANANRTKAKTILILGDSLSAEYGLKRGTGWVALLEKKLAAQRLAAQLVNASISGDTTAGGRSRLAMLLTQHQPDLVLLELGGNDALRGLALQDTQDNLMAMSQSAQAAGAQVVLLGIELPPNYGREYSQRLARLYQQVAKAQNCALVPFLLRGVADQPDRQKWFQADQIHPLEIAQPIILANVWPTLSKALR